MSVKSILLVGVLCVLGFIVLESVISGRWQEERRAVEVEQAKRDSLVASRVDSSIAHAESLAKARSEEMMSNIRTDIKQLEPYSTEIPVNESPVGRPAKTELQGVTERYGRLIEQYGRNQAGVMIKREQDEAFKAKDFKRLEILTNASAKAMRGDYERSRTQVAENVSWDALQIGKRYRISRQTMLMPEGRNPVDATTAMANVRKMSPGVTFVVTGIDRSEIPVWYEVNADGHYGWINGLALSGQDLR